MRVIKCDICGAIYKENEKKGGYIMMRMNTNNIDDDHHFDVCPDCFNSVKNYILEKTVKEDDTNC